MDPDSRDKADDSWVIDKMIRYIARHFPELEAEPAIAETCMYTVYIYSTIYFLTFQTQAPDIMRKGFILMRESLGKVPIASNSLLEVLGVISFQFFTKLFSKRVHNGNTSLVFLNIHILCNVYSRCPLTQILSLTGSILAKYNHRSRIFR